MNTLIKQYEKDRLEVAVLTRSTVDTYVSSITSFCDFVCNCYHINPLEARGKQLLAWLEVMRPTISRSRLRQHQYALKSFFAFLYKLGVISNNPAEALPSLQKKPSKKIQPVPENEVFRLLAAVDRSTWYGKRNHLVFAMLWCLGLRISELTRLKVKSFEKGDNPDNKIGLLRVRGKNKKQRALFVVASLYDELCSYLQEPQSPKNKDAPLFTAKKEKTISNNRIQKLIKEYVQKAAIKSTITPHILRHTFATEMYRQGVPFDAIQAMLGHEKQEETALYIHVPIQMQKEALEQISLTGGKSWQ